jgi:hypothetical protein
VNRRALLLGLGASLLAREALAGPRRAYRTAHRDHTRELRLYRDFSTALLLRATLLTPGFREALALERRRLLDPTEANHAEFVARMQHDGAAYHEVVFTADSALPDGELFGPGDDAWNIRLEVDSQQAELLAVEHVRDPTPLHRGLYLQHTRWSQLWIARFRRVTEAPRTVTLHVGSGYGHGEVVWDLGQR